MLDTLLTTVLFEEAVDLDTFTPLQDCDENTLRMPKYRACLDAEPLFSQAFQQAKTANQALMVIFGFDSCPPCKSLDKQVFAAATPMKNADLVKYLSKPAINTYVLGQKPLKISVLRINAKTKHGKALARSIGALAPDERMRAPLIVFINPHSKHIFKEALNPTQASYCDWGAQFAAGLEAVGMVQMGMPYAPRKRCS